MREIGATVGRLALGKKDSLALAKTQKAVARYHLERGPIV
jgi:hypothetical protein